MMSSKAVFLNVDLGLAQENYADYEILCKRTLLYF